MCVCVCVCFVKKNFNEVLYVCKTFLLRMFAFHHYLTISIEELLTNKEEARNAAKQEGGSQRGKASKEGRKADTKMTPKNVKMGHMKAKPPQKSSSRIKASALASRLPSDMAQPSQQFAPLRYVSFVPEEKLSSKLQCLLLFRINTKKAKKQKNKKQTNQTGAKS